VNYSQTGRAHHRPQPHLATAHHGAVNLPAFLLRGTSSLRQVGGSHLLFLLRAFGIAQNASCVGLAFFRLPSSPLLEVPK
jgi:hypothetical protein